MAYSFKNNFPSASTYKKTITNPDTGEKISSGKDYDILSNSEKLAQAGLQAPLSKGGGVEEAVTSIFASLGIVVAGQSNDSTASILSGDDLQDNDSETVTPTTDGNPNIQTDKIAQLKPRKVPTSEIFNQTTDNPINEADECQPEQYKKKQGQDKKISPPEVEDMAFDLIEESKENLGQIYGNNS